MRRRYRVVVVGALVGLIGALGVNPIPVSAQSSANGWGAAEETEFVRLINDLRASQGVPPLEVNLELIAQARVWSQTMKDRGTIFHSGDLGAGVSANWRKLGENVGVGGTVQALFDAFVASPTHYQNLVDSDFRTIGIGVVWDGTRMFTAHRFMAVFPPKAPAPAPPAPALQSQQPSPPSLPVSPPPPGREPAVASPAPPAPSPVPIAASPAPALGAADTLDMDRVDEVLDLLAQFDRI